MTVAIEIEQDSIAATPPKEIQTLEHLLNAWLLIQENCYINQQTITSLCDQYQLLKVSAYHNTRAKRFQQLIQEILLQPIMPPNSAADQQKALLIRLCQWLIKNSSTDKWQQVLQRRLSDKMCLIKQTVERQMRIEVENETNIKLSMSFQILTKENNTSTPIYEGESIFLFQISENFDVHQSLHTHAKLFKPSMSEHFTTPPLDEQINHYIQTSHSTLHDDEIKILQASRDYYLNEITEQELQQQYISTNVYSAEFKNSAGYELIKEIISCRPIRGFTL